MYPQSNSARSVRDLSGVWDFRFNADEPWQPIAVPASYNDQSPDPEFRRHYGMAYYRTTFTVPEGARRVLRFDAVTHNAVVRLNGQESASHRGGFLPFEADITALAQPGETVTLDVEVDNRIGHSSLPVGNEGGTAFFGSDNAGIPAVEAGKARQQAQGINLPNFDFFNYAGITRPVHLYTTPAAYIRDVTVAADMTGTLRYTVDTVGEGSVKVEILDAEDRVVACADGAAGTVQVENARLWQPRPGTPYLYTALVKFGKDEYRQKFGFRSVEVSGHKFLINGAPFYFKGPCKHEDSAFRGRGYDACVTVTDLKLYEWLNANCLRMSHYPYAEEVYDLCDRLGIVVIDETPAVGIGAGTACDPYKTFPLKAYHSAVLRAMIKRDKNHPCVVLWSLGNEPDTEHFPESARDYWRPLYEQAHTQDPQDRPVTMVCCQNDYTKDITTRTMDVVCINRYYGWYNLSGDLDNAAYAFTARTRWPVCTALPPRCSPRSSRSSITARSTAVWMSAVLSWASGRGTSRTSRPSRVRCAWAAATARVCSPVSAPPSWPPTTSVIAGAKRNRTTGKHYP